MPDVIFNMKGPENAIRCTEKKNILVERDKIIIFRWYDYIPGKRMNGKNF